MILKHLLLYKFTYWQEKLFITKGGNSRMHPIKLVPIRDAVKRLLKFLILF